VIETVVKLGRAVLAEGPLAALGHIPPDGRTLIVPGGGAFADTVRALDARLAIGDDAAHWAAILGMDQYAYVLSALVPHSRLIVEPDNAAGLPILAPFRWIHTADPLPHSWDVTSDSIAAWIAGAIGAPRLLLVKPVGSGLGLADRYFPHAKPSGVDVRVLGVKEIDTLSSVLASPAAWHNLSEP
jgi:5-(aminomethyl)-3-furanmethanol phosphate kinase